MIRKSPLLLAAAALAVSSPLTNAEDLSSVIASDSKAVQLGTGMAFTEGPVWIPAEKKLIFSDIPKSLHMQWTEKDGVTKLREVEATNGNLLDLDGGLLSCQHGGRNVIKWEDGKPKVLVSEWDGKKFNSPNDIAVLN